MDKKLKHLEFIQNVITRMNNNSFLIKGWTITLVAALFALAAKDANVKYVLVSYIPIPTFWILDGFFIATERQYRCLYNEVSLKSADEIDFNMSATDFNDGNKTWLSGIFSKTLMVFYGTCVMTILIVMFILR